MIEHKQKTLKNWRTRTLLLATMLSMGGWIVLSEVALARFARLYSVEGSTVELQRYNWSAFYPTYPRTMLTSEDLLRVEIGTSVVLLCSDGVLRDWIGAGVDNVGSTCPGTPRRVRPSFGISAQWSANDPTVPYVINPGVGQVLTTTPRLRWNEVAGAQQYEVTLQRREGDRWVEVWTTTSSQASLCYPRDEVELEPGEEYRLQVSAVDGADVIEAEPANSVFSPVSGSERQAAEAAIAAVEALEINQATKVLILVEEVYPQFKLFDQGINELRSLIRSGQATAQVYRLLGDYYIRSGLELPTQESYLQAIALAQSAENLEEEALATWGLGTVHGRVGNTEQALIYLQQAQQLATEIGDSELVESITIELARLPEV